jgi:peptidyl-prolyl cis-trans isomerase D
MKTFTSVQRGNAEVDADVLRYAFSMPKPQAGAATYGGVMTASGDFAVIALQEVSAGTMAAVTPEQKTAIASQLGNIYGKNDFASYQKFLKDSADITEK